MIRALFSGLLCCSIAGIVILLAWLSGTESRVRARYVVLAVPISFFAVAYSVQNDLDYGDSFGQFVGAIALGLLAAWAILTCVVAVIESFSAPHLPAAAPGSAASNIGQAMSFAGAASSGPVAVGVWGANQQMQRANTHLRSIDSELRKSGTQRTVRGQTPAEHSSEFAECRHCGGSTLLKGGATSFRCGRCGYRN